MIFTLQQVRAISDGIWGNKLSAVDSGWYKHCFQLSFRQGDFNTSLSISEYPTKGVQCCFTATFWDKTVRVVADRWYGDSVETLFTVSGDPSVGEELWLCFLAELGYLFNDLGYLDLNEAARSLDSVSITSYPTFIIGE